MMHFTIVGSRGSSAKDCYALYDIGLELLQHGGIGRSGLAEGPDDTLTAAVADVMRDTGLRGTDLAELYLPWPGFNGYWGGNLDGAVIDAKKLENHIRARRIVSEIHKGWDYLTNGGRLLHTRNAYQPLGLDLETPSEAVIYSAKENSQRQVHGGTSTCIMLARGWLIPTFNIRIAEDVDKLQEWMETITG